MNTVADIMQGALARVVSLPGRPSGKVAPSGWLVMGIPAKPVHKMSPEEPEDIRQNAIECLELRRTNRPR